MTTTLERRKTVGPSAGSDAVQSSRSQPGRVGAVLARAIVFEDFGGIADFEVFEEPPPLNAASTKRSSARPERSRWDVLKGERPGSEVQFPANILRFRSRRSDAAEGGTNLAPRRWGLIATVAAGSLIAVTGLMLNSPWMSVKTVTIVGFDEAATASVQQELVSLQGQPLVRLSAAALSDRLAKRPDVAAVSVEKAWPDEVVVRVAQRIPTARIRVGSAPSAIVDRVGNAMSIESLASLPLVSLQSGTETSVRLATDRAVAIVASFVEASPSLPGAVSSIDQFGDEFVVRIGRSRIALGRAEQLSAKARVIAALHRSGELARYSDMDIAVPDAAIVTQAKLRPQR